MLSETFNLPAPLLADPIRSNPDPVLFYRPPTGWFGDVMPIQVDGVFHIFYCFLRSDDRGAPDVMKKLQWAHLVTTDFVTVEELSEAIAAGGADDMDLLSGAGSVVGPVDGRYIAFYVGINPRRMDIGEPEQVVLRATSTDLTTWTKDPDFIFKADERWYERDAWRDPFVYPHAGGWRMLLCAREPSAPFDRRGVVGLAFSHDLNDWAAEPPFLAPGTTYAPECPEIFRMGSDWYLVYSTYGDRFATRYRHAPTADGPWKMPDDDALESNDVYAMNTMGDGNRRYLVGWLATRSEDSDGGHRQWGGDMITHELVRRPDGQLGTVPLDALLRRFAMASGKPDIRQGEWALADGSASFDGSGFGWCSLGEIGNSPVLLDVTIDLSAVPEEFGLALRAEDDFSATYLLRFEPRNGRVVFDRRPHAIDNPFRFDTDRSYVSSADYEIERPLRSEGGSIRVRALVDGSAIVIYIGDVALSTRGYDLSGGHLGIYAANGIARFHTIHVGRAEG